MLSQQYLVMQGFEQIMEQQGAGKNKKNIYVKKIKSLLEFSNNSLSTLPKQKKIQKVSSHQSRGQANKREKNRESARRARLRKKLYIELLEKTTFKLQQIAHEGKMIESQVNEHLNSLKCENKYDEGQNLYDDIGMFFQNKDSVQNDRTTENKDKILQQLKYVLNFSTENSIQEEEVMNQFCRLKTDSLEYRLLNEMGKLQSQLKSLQQKSTRSQNENTKLGDKERSKTIFELNKHWMGNKKVESHPIKAQQIDLEQMETLLAKVSNFLNIPIDF